MLSSGKTVAEIGFLCALSMLMVATLPDSTKATALQDLLLAVLVQSDDIKLAPNHAELPNLLARMKPSALAKHVHKQKVPTDAFAIALPLPINKM